MAGVRRFLYIDSERCQGCGTCQLVCAALRRRQWNPALGLIRAVDDHELKRHMGISCMHCDDPACALACLMNVIYRDEEQELVLRRLEGCIGCRACEAACPFGAAVYDHINEKEAACDLCLGEPQCVAYCPHQALSFISQEEEMAMKRQQRADLLFGPAAPWYEKEPGGESAQ